MWRRCYKEKSLMECGERLWWSFEQMSFIEQRDELGGLKRPAGWSVETVFNGMNRWVWQNEETSLMKWGDQSDRVWRQVNFDGVRRWAQWSKKVSLLECADRQTLMEWWDKSLMEQGDQLAGMWRQTLMEWGGKLDGTRRPSWWNVQINFDGMKWDEPNGSRRPRWWNVQTLTLTNEMSPME